MSIRLPEDLTQGIRAEVLNGHFASEDEAVAEAVRQFLSRRQDATPIEVIGSIGAMRGDAELLDRITEDIMQSRLTRALRLPSDE
jgi:Arc/MetJ-type ribon-helix-helix transcriptional regulator